MKKHLLTLLPVMLLTACGYSVIKDQETEAVYLGVENYGAEEVNKDTKEDFSYRFEIDGKEEILKVDSGAKNSEGEYEYPIQNQLKEGYTFLFSDRDAYEYRLPRSRQGCTEVPLP